MANKILDIRGTVYKTRLTNTSVLMCIKAI